MDGQSNQSVALKQKLYKYLLKILHYYKRIITKGWLYDYGRKLEFKNNFATKKKYC